MLEPLSVMKISRVLSAQLPCIQLLHEDAHVVVDIGNHAVKSGGFVVAVVLYMALYLSATMYGECGALVEI